MYEADRYGKISPHPISTCTPHRSSKFEKIIILKTYFQFLNIVTLKFETNSVKQFPKNNDTTKNRYNIYKTTYVTNFQKI